MPTIVGNSPLEQEAVRSKKIASLPLCDLHYCEIGSGPPLIIVPATMSLLDDWIGLAAFMSQRFKVYFFELPGHGKSTALDYYSNEQMAIVVKDLMDHLHLDRVSLMGFSFGGLLALTALNLLSSRIDQVIMISPLVDSAAIRFSPSSKAVIRSFVAAAQRPRLQEFGHRTLQSNLGSTLWARFAVEFANIEHFDILKENLQATSLSTIQALSGQMREIFHSHQFINACYTQPCFFAMSVLDPLIDFTFTSAAVKQMFPTVEEIRLYLPYHRPRVLPTLEYLNRTYPDIMEIAPHFI
jgi:pimeloyl-ACP methyl ester carboxylesterase